MSAQMHTIYSERIKGVGVHEGGPYLSMGYYGEGLENLSVETISAEITRVVELNYDYGAIDNPSNFKDSPVYIISGEFDPVAPTKM